MSHDKEVTVKEEEVEIKVSDIETLPTVSENTENEQINLTFCNAPPAQVDHHISIVPTADTASKGSNTTITELAGAALKVATEEEEQSTDQGSPVSMFPTLCCEEAQELPEAAPNVVSMTSHTIRSQSPDEDANEAARAFQHEEASFIIISHDHSTQTKYNWLSKIRSPENDEQDITVTLSSPAENEFPATRPLSIASSQTLDRQDDDEVANSNKHGLITNMKDQQTLPAEKLQPVTVDGANARHHAKSSSMSPTTRTHLSDRLRTSSLSSSTKIPRPSSASPPSSTKHRIIAPCASPTPSKGLLDNEINFSSHSVSNSSASSTKSQNPTPWSFGSMSASGSVPSTTETPASQHPRARAGSMPWETVTNRSVSKTKAPPTRSRTPKSKTEDVKPKPEGRQASTAHGQRKKLAPLPTLSQQEPAKQVSLDTATTRPALVSTVNGAASRAGTALNWRSAAVLQPPKTVATPAAPIQAGKNHTGLHGQKKALIQSSGVKGGKVMTEVAKQNTLSFCGDDADVQTNARAGPPAFGTAETIEGVVWGVDKVYEATLMKQMLKRESKSWADMADEDEW